MANKIMFKVNSTDYSNRVVGAAYAVQSNEEYELWTDANGKEHRSAYRSRITGKFTMYFPTMSDFTSFQTTMNTNKGADLTYPISVFDNKSGTTKSIRAFVEYQLVQYRGPAFDDRMEQVEVSIREQ